MIVFGIVGEDAKQNAHPLLRCATALHWDMEQTSPLSQGEWGKPYFQAISDRHFNLSHSGSIALCALDTTPVGVDIQRLRPTRTKFLDQICSAEERAWLLDCSDSETAFALLWALKESLCKYTGRGITRPISQIKVPLPHALPLSDTWETMTLHGLFFSICSCEHGMIALCGEHTPTQPIQWMDHVT